MTASWRGLARAAALAVLLWPAAAQAGRDEARAVLLDWYRLVLELVRHTPTYSPPVASRSFAYLGVAAYESVASGTDGMGTLAGQLTGLAPLPPREAGVAYDEAVALDAALAASVATYFANTGPTGQRAMAAMAKRLAARAAEGVAPDVADRSRAYGAAVAAHILAWSATDGGATVENMGFPLTWALTEGPGHWTPTSLIVQQQAPLLPGWGQNRAFAMPDGAACPLPPPPAYSEDKGSVFFAQALEVYGTKNALTADQKAVARFWSDDPMLSPTPPGHWISIALQIIDRDDVDLDRSADVLARLGVTLADAFIGCWRTKYEYDLLRPVSYIRRLIDPKWETLLTTPPFPEYPSGHSTQSAAAATVLTAAFGEGFAFDDATHEDDGLPPRHFASFWQAAEEAGISRLYGGIHFRAAVERGLEQGRCVGAFAVRLRTLE